MRNPRGHLEVSEQRNEGLVAGKRASRSSRDQVSRSWGEETSGNLPVAKVAAPQRTGTEASGAWGSDQSQPDQLPTLLAQFLLSRGVQKLLTVPPRKTHFSLLQPSGFLCAIRAQEVPTRAVSGAGILALFWVCLGKVRVHGGEEEPWVWAPVFHTREILAF